MNRIKKLVIRGFQSHTDTTIEFGPITVLVGDNETGKSAVIRALKWVCFNEWDGKGTEFINWDMDSCEVELHLTNAIITRKRSKDENLYTLNGEVFKAFGMKVPDPIAKTLNLTKDNFQEQLDSPYWLMLNSGQAAAALNEIFNLSKIDQTISNVGCELREARTRVKLCGERVQNALELRDSLSWVVEASKDLKELEALNKEIEDAREEIRQVTETQEMTMGLEEEIGELTQGISLLNQAIMSGEEWLTVYLQIKNIKDTMEMMEEVNSLSKTLNSKEAQLNKWLQSSCPLCGRG